MGCAALFCCLQLIPPTQGWCPLLSPQTIVSELGKGPCGKMKPLCRWAVQWPQQFLIAAEVGEGLCLFSAPPERTQRTGTALFSQFLLFFGKENCLPCPACSAVIPWAPSPTQKCCWWRAGSLQLSRVKIQGWGAVLVPQRGRAWPRECEAIVEELFFLLSQDAHKSSFRHWTPKCAGVWGRREGKGCSAVQESWAGLQDVFSPDPVQSIYWC